MPVLNDQILAHFEAQPEGTIVGPAAFSELAPKVEVEGALAFLHGLGRLLRLGPAQFVMPLQTRFGVIPPALEKVLESITSATSETIAPQGAAAANALGWVPQVPVRTIYWTSGESRALELGAQVVELRHVPGWQLLLAHRPAGQVIRALAWLERPLPHQWRLETERRLIKKERTELASVSSQLPEWMAEQVSTLA